MERKSITIRTTKTAPNLLERETHKKKNLNEREIFFIFYWHIPSGKSNTILLQPLLQTAIKIDETVSNVTLSEKKSTHKHMLHRREMNALPSLFMHSCCCITSKTKAKK